MVAMASEPASRAWSVANPMARMTTPNSRPIRPTFWLYRCMAGSFRGRRGSVNARSGPLVRSSADVPISGSASWPARRLRHPPGGGGRVLLAGDDHRVGLGYRQPMDDSPRRRWRDARLRPWMVDGLLGVAVAAVQLLMLALGVNQSGPVPYAKPNALTVLLILAQG